MIKDISTVFPVYKLTYIPTIKSAYDYSYGTDKYILIKHDWYVADIDGCLIPITKSSLLKILNMEFNEIYGVMHEQLELNFI